jgi:ankyrin repeat protein
MKIKTCLVVILSALTALAHAATNDLTGLLQKGLFEEEANRNLDAAISNYQSLANAFDKDRQVAATAIFRLGECYRKLGRTNEAVAQYQRIVRDFGDQQTLVTLSQQNLAGLGAPPNSMEARQAQARGSESLQQLQSALTKEEDEYAQKKATLDALKKLNSYEMKRALPTVVPDNQLNVLMSELDLAEQNFMKLKPDFAEDHPKYQSAKEQVDALNKKVDDRIQGILTGLQAQLDVSQAHQLWLEHEIQNAGPSNAAKPANGEQAPITDEEEKEIRRIQVMIKNSPDLINAPEGEADANGNPNLTPLGHAAELGQLRVAKFLLEAKADVNLKTHFMTPLQHAAANGHRAMVELLLANGAEVNTKGSYERTALHEAAKHGFVSVAEALLAAKADVNAQDGQGNTALTLAVQNSFRPVAELLLSHGADPNIMTTNVPESWAMSGDRVGAPLHFAIYKGDKPMVSLLLSNHANVALRNPHTHMTALEIAAARGEVEIARRLLDAGANPNPDPADPEDWGALSRAAGAGKADVVSLLLARGADPNGGFYWKGPTEKYEGPQGITPLASAVLGDHQTIVTNLLQNKADPNIRNSDGSTAFWNGFGRPGATNLIPMLESGADPNQTNGGGYSPLMGVVESGSFLSSSDRVAVAKLLIEKGADVNARRPDGITALHLAASYQRPELIQLLLANKADVNVADQNGRTPLEFAKEKEAQRQAGPPGFLSPVPLPPQPGVRPLRSLPNRNSGVTPIPGGAASSSETPAVPQDIIAMLREHGALDELPNFSAIRLTREGMTSPSKIFGQDSNGWIQVTLFDVLGVQYHLLSAWTIGQDRVWTSIYGMTPQPNTLPFPDLKRIVIHRPAGEGAKSKELKVDVGHLLDTAECSGDVPLKFGDVVEIPEADHVINENWTGLRTNEMLNLRECVTRHLQIIVNGKTSNITLAPEIRSGSGFVDGTVMMKDGIQLLQYQPLMLWPVLENSKLLLASSDLSRIKVTRRDAVTGKTHEWTVDCTNLKSSPPNFWLRDGDVIEVPEKAGE